MARSLKFVDHTCPGCKAVYRISVDPDLQPLCCKLCNFPIGQLRETIANIFAIEYAERPGHI